MNSKGHNNNKFYQNLLKDRLKDDFILDFENPNPDYLLYNVYNNDDLLPIYSNMNPIRIAMYTENVMADLNYADYVIGPYYINYFDRFFKYATFLYQNFNIR